MKLSYPLLAAIALWVLAWPQQAAAQAFTDCPDTENTCVVEWATAQGEPIINALRNTIANDDPRPAGRVYVLQRGGFYYNTDHISNTGFHLRLIGQTAEEGEAAGHNECGPAGNEDCGPAIIQRFRREDQSVDGLMIESSGNGNGGFTLRNLWIMGQDNTGITGSYEPITINSSNSRFVIDNVIFDRNDWHHLGFKGGGNNVFVTNSHFRNMAEKNPTQIWAGRGLRFEAGADSVVFENNSFFNIQSFPVQSEAAPIGYFLFNHNTLVNFGRNFNAGGIWQESYVANNVMVNPFWQGESPEQYDSRLATWVAEGNDPADFDPYLGVFGIDPLPSQFGLETDRRIVLANNAWWRSPEVEGIHGPLEIRSQPLVSDSTMAFFERFEGMVMQGNLNTNPMLDAAPTTSGVYDQINSFLTAWVNNAPTPWTGIFWDPGRPDNPQAINWPLPEDFSYTNEALLNAGTDNLPLGDLNWFPQAKDDYLTNRASYIQELKEMAGGAPETPVSTDVIQAERAAELEGAEIQAVEGFTSFFITSGGSIRWQFEVPSDGVYGLNVMTNMRNETQRGQHIRLRAVGGDATGLRNDPGFGEFYFCTAAQEGCANPLPQDEWATVEIRQENLITEQSDALTLEAGVTYELEIAPSWGYQGFSTVTVVDAGGQEVAALTPPTAESVGVQEICAEGVEYCPAGFRWVEVGAGGRVTWNVNVPEGINSALIRLFYQAPTGSTGTILVDGQERQSISFPAVATGNGEAVTDRFELSPGTHQITVASSSGGLNLDYAVMLSYAGEVTSTEPGALPEGYALDQNYPNPFGAATTIRYELGASSAVKLTVYDLLGRKVATLVDELQPAGQHSVRLDASSLSSGTYFYRLETGVGQRVRSMVLVK